MDLDYRGFDIMITAILRPIFICLTISSLLVYADIQSEQTPPEGFDGILRNYVVEGKVDYVAIAKAEDFKTYVDYVAKRDVSALATTQEQLVFYINAYNALSIQGVLNDRSPSSFFGRRGFFHSAKYQIAGNKMNLYDFEHKIIRPLGEPRIHFALVCASVSCPKLRSEAYKLDILEQQLDEDARSFINDKEKNWFDVDKKVAHLSMIFKWFKEDFKKNNLSLQQYIAQYVHDKEVVDLLKNNAFKIKYLKYDWSLNGSR